MSSLRRKTKRESFKNEIPNICFVEGNRTLRRAIKNRRVANPDRVDQLGSVTYIRTTSR